MIYGFENLSDFYLDVARSRVSGIESKKSFGYCPSINTGGKDMCFNGVIYMPTTAQSIEVVSDNVNDTSAGTGARTVLVKGLDANFAYQEETIIMLGLVPVASLLTWIRVHEVCVVTTGTYGVANTGTILVRVPAGTTFLTMDAGQGDTQNSLTTVPSGKTLYAQLVHITVETNKQIDFHFWQRQNANTVSAPFTGKRVVQRYAGIGEGKAFNYSTAPFKFPEMTDVWFSAMTSSGTAAASVEYAKILIDN
jgi:hypothetical protein